MPTILDAIKAKNPELLKKLVTERIHQNIREGLDAEKKAVASSLLVPRLAEVYINVGDRIRTKRMGQTAGTVVKVENGNVYFELDEPEGKFGKRVWAAPLSNVVKEAMGHVGDTPADKGRMAAADDDYNKKYDVPFKKKDGTTVNRKVTVPPSNNESVNEGLWDAIKALPMAATIAKRGVTSADLDKAKKIALHFGPAMTAIALKCDYDDPKEKKFVDDWVAATKRKAGVTEEIVSQHEVQRIYDEVGDIGETELLCGISSLRVNPHGQVISYICEATGTGFPGGWDKGWTYPYRIGGGGSERPFLKDGRWYLVVWNQETSKKEIYSFYDDVFIPEKEFYKESADRWKAPKHIPEPIPCGPDCRKGDDHDPDYYCGEGKPWKDHKLKEDEAYDPGSAKRHECPKCKHVWWGVALKNCPKCERAINESEEDSTEASTLGWPPGRWMKTFQYKGATYTFHRWIDEKHGPEVGAIYRSTLGKTLHVYND